MTDEKRTDAEAVLSGDLFGGAGSEAMERSAHLSACRTYRYALWRRWGRGDYAISSA